MRLEIFCEDQLGLMRKLPDLLVMQSIDLRGMEIDPVGLIYLNVSTPDFNIFRRLMIDIRRICGVQEVKTVTFMPSEREHRAMLAMLESLPEPAFSIDLKGKVVFANHSAVTLFDLSQLSRSNQPPVGNLISGFNFQQWLDGGSISTHSEQIVVRGKNYLMEITPISLGEEGVSQDPVGSVIVLKFTSQIDRHLHAASQADALSLGSMAAVSPKMKQVIEQARKIAPLDAPLLILGETGTGKDILAKACHLYSARRDKPFLALNCAALPDDVAESELFGHAAGAYPNALEGKKGFFEQANGGSVLLDEIGEMSSSMQAKLLRFLNDGTFRRVGEENEIYVDVRVICATQKNLLDLVKKGIFREDLYYRLNVLMLHIPPLRERLQDILPLMEQLTVQMADEQGLRRPRLANELNDFLCQYRWPGNVRQLKNILYRALIQLERDELQPQDIVLPELTVEMAIGEDALDGSLDDICKRFECAVLTRLYRDYPSTRKLAKRLNVSHTAVANKLREYGLSRRGKAKIENKE